MDFFKYISSTKKKKVRDIQGIPESLGTLKLRVYVWNYMHPQLFYISPPKGSPRIILEIPPPLNKAKSEIFQHH